MRTARCHSGRSRPPNLGPRGRRFKFSLPDQLKTKVSVARLRRPKNLTQGEQFNQLHLQLVRFYVRAPLAIPSQRLIALSQLRLECVLDSATALKFYGRVQLRAAGVVHLVKLRATRACDAVFTLPGVLGNLAPFEVERIGFLSGESIYRSSAGW
jgi:hypothetical protein